jgi:hypothetical protein
MAEEGSNNTGGLTSKEMWVRVDGKLDAVLARQGAYDVELALLKARDEERKAQVIALQALTDSTAKDVKAALEKREEIIDEKMDELKSGQSETLRKLAYATGTVVGALAIFNAVEIFIRYH